MNLASSLSILRHALLASAVSAGLLGAASPAPAQPVVHAAPPATSFAEASGLFRSGRHAAAYARFVALANQGDMQAARVALVMHRFGVSLFGSEWDATTEELEDWSRLARLAEAKDVAQRHRGEPFDSPARPGPAAAASGVLRMSTFRAHPRGPARAPR